ncbi:FHA domain-containing protein [Lachnospiraceae bacterium OttesenSCG-928-D06]|nr:FHA domain-containing protein [Lachnospiraceae bacterium OttesenSCG-928-D06]
MIKMVIEQQNHRNYLKYVLEETQVIDEDCVATISDEAVQEEKQVIDGIIPVIYSQVFGERILRYDINSYTPLLEYKNRISSKEQVCKVLLSIIDTYQQADAYLLDLAYFLMEEEYIFIDERTGRAHLILCPVVSERDPDDLVQLFRNIVYGIHMSKESMEFYGEVIMCLNHIETFNIIKFREILASAESMPTIFESPKKEREIKKDSSFDIRPKYENSVSNTKINISENSTMMPEIPPVLEESKERKGILNTLFKKKEKTEQKTKTPAKKKNSKSIILLPDEEISKSEVDMKQADIQSIGEEKKIKTEKNDIKKQTHINQPIVKADEFGYEPTEDELDEQAYISLYHVSEERHIPIHVYPFEIGREGDYKINASKTKISRKHAVITKSEDGFMVCDLSKHGTFIDGKRIGKGSYVLLKDGMQLMLKDEVFNVSIYGL